MKQHRIPKLSLGTVAFGLDYSINRTNGKPDLSESLSILQAAWNAGITCLDTARTYGTAEEVVGAFLSQQSPGEQAYVVTKFKLDIADLGSLERAVQSVEDSVRASLAALKCAQIPLALIHMERHLPYEIVYQVLTESITRLKSLGLIERGGMSIDHPDELHHFWNHPQLDAFQVPMNIWDHRLLSVGLLEKIEQAGKIVFVRSVFLKGLFFRTPESLTGNLKEAAPYLQQLQQLAQREQLSVAQVAFSFVRDLPGVSSLLIGADRVEHIADNVALLQGPPLQIETQAAIFKLFASVPEHIITPGMWEL
jgi:aryl-alcohol dehydrogenase-like predicted oxidoreductase